MFKDLITEHPELVVTIFSGFLLPIILVWLNQRYNLKSKEKEKEIERSFTFNREHVNHEKVIHSSLIKILFEIQKLYINLSCDSDHDSCITDAVKEFQKDFSKYQGIISDNQIFLKSKVVNELYKFYNKIGEILINLNEINKTKEHELARVCVYDGAQDLANFILNIQEVFLSKRKSLYGELKIIRTEMKDFQTCCGPPPPGELRDRYNKVMREIKKIPEPVELKPQPITIDKK